MTPKEILLKIVLKIKWVIFSKIDCYGLRKFCVANETVVFLPGARVHNLQGNKEQIAIGSKSVIACQLNVFRNGGFISIGSNCFLGENSRLWSSSSIVLGDNVLISHDVNIHDTDAHSISAASRREHFSEIFGRGHPAELPDVATKPISIENDVWVGFGASILKGITIGEGAIIGACSVVTKDVAPYAIMAGNPARQIGWAKK